jgi:hypothetical protein
MKRFGIVLAAGLVTSLLVYFAVVQILAASQPTAPFDPTIVTPQPMIPLLSNPLTAGLFWTGLLLGEFSAGLLALKLYSLLSSKDAPEEVRDDSLEIQNLFDSFLTN